LKEEDKGFLFSSFLCQKQYYKKLKEKGMAVDKQD
jgi:hypothetical protein